MSAGRSLRLVLDVTHDDWRSLERDVRRGLREIRRDHPTPDSEGGTVDGRQATSGPARIVAAITPNRYGGLLVQQFEVFAYSPRTQGGDA